MSRIFHAAQPSNRSSFIGNVRYVRGASMLINRTFVRSFDWSSTTLGPIETWPRSLRAYVEMILDLPTPAIVFWGPDKTQIYNDGYAVIMGPRHPRYFGRPYLECWPDTAPTILPWMREVTEEGRPLQVARAPFTLTRHGFNEEAYFTFTFSALRDDEGAIAGIYQPVVEATEAVLLDRRADVLRNLALRRDVFGDAVATLGANPHDIPFAAFYAADERNGELHIVGATGFASPAAGDVALESVRAAALDAYRANEATEVDIAITAGPWPEAIARAFVCPIRPLPRDAPSGVAVFGISPRLRFDVAYREFFETLVGELGGILEAMRSARMMNEWRERDEVAQQALLVSEERFRAFVTASSDVMYRMSADWRELRQLTGRQFIADTNAPTQTWLDGYVPPEDRPRVVAAIEEATRTKSTFAVEHQVFRLDGSIGWVVSRAIPILGPDGEIQEWFGAASDVTERKLAEEALRQADQRKDDFLSMLSHELRNPLAPIRTGVHLLAQVDPASPAAARARTIIERQTEHLTRIVDDLLDVTRIARGKIEIRPHRIDLADLTRQQGDDHRTTLANQGVTLDVDVPAEPIWTVVDATRIAQVIGNLLQNAGKFTPRGGTVALQARRQGAVAEVRVRDSGMGIDPSLAGHVFEPFVQGASTLARTKGGLGLGLALVKGIVELHGGTVRVSSQGADCGAEFVVQLPLAEAPTAAPSATSPGLSTGGRRVLVVDDNQDAAELLAELVRMLGHEVDVVFDGPGAVARARDNAYDVVLCDIGLPGMNGYEVAKALSTSERRPTRIVAVSGYAREEDRARAREAGFHEHLAKPADPARIAQLLS